MEQRTSNTGFKVISFYLDTIIKCMSEYVVCVYVANVRFYLTKTRDLLGIAEARAEGKCVIHYLVF